MPLDRKIFFDRVRSSLFSGSMSQSQVDGMNAILDEASKAVEQGMAWVVLDMRHLAYSFATTYHETAKTMLPIEEYGKGKGMAYGVPDPATGKTYYGRGYVQLTWADNYKKATAKLGLSGSSDLYWNPERALNPNIAADIMFQGMEEGWFRSDKSGRQTLTRYFNDNVDDPFGAREIINGDKNIVPSWSHGVSIGNLIKGYHENFLVALRAAWTEPAPPPTPVPPEISVGDIVRTIKGAAYTGTVVSVYKTLDGTPHADVEATVPEFKGTVHVYKTTMIERVEN